MLKNKILNLSAIALLAFFSANSTYSMDQNGEAEKEKRESFEADKRTKNVEYEKLLEELNNLKFSGKVKDGLIKGSTDAFASSISGLIVEGGKRSFDVIFDYCPTTATLLSEISSGNDVITKRLANVVALYNNKRAFSNNEKESQELKTSTHQKIKSVEHDQNELDSQFAATLKKRNPNYKPYGA